MLRPHHGILRPYVLAVTSLLPACAIGSPFAVQQVTVAVVQVTPTEDTLRAIGATRQFTATPRDPQGRIIVGVTVYWNSSNASVASVDASGLVTAHANGQTTIGASSGVITGHAMLTVKGP
jgi:uncharacterized protein YjdB